MWLGQQSPMISDQKQPPQNLHLNASHHWLTLENMCHHATQYVRQQNHTAQDSFMMLEFLCDSLTSDACATVTLEPKKDLIGSDNTADRPCFLKAILIKFHVETMAMNYHLTMQLIALPKTIVMMNLNIGVFNSKVKGITMELVPVVKCCLICLCTSF